MQVFSIAGNQQEEFEVFEEESEDLEEDVDEDSDDSAE